MTAAVDSRASLPGRLRLRLANANPVLVKDLRGRFRGARAFIVLTLFLVFIAGAAWLAYGALGLATQLVSGPYLGQLPGASSLPQSAIVGQAVFAAVAAAQMVVVLLVGPMMTAGSISGEVERQTWELLRATPLSAMDIVRGKVGAAMAFIALLALAALPVMSLGFVFGGVSFVRVVTTQLELVATGFVFSSLGVLMSALTLNTTRAVIGSLIVIFGLYLCQLCGLPFAMMTGIANGLLQPGVVDVFSPGMAFGMALATGTASLASILGNLMLGYALMLIASTKVRPGERQVAILVTVLVAGWWALQYVGAGIAMFLTSSMTRMVTP